MATVQQKVRLLRLWFHESKSIVTVQRCFRLEYRNCQSPSNDSIKRWYEHFKGTGKMLDDHRSQTKLLNECGRLSLLNCSYQRLMELLPTISVSVRRAFC
ncbi:hypothetical protein AVEN_268425-1 [Araneus ventricosus]|uniref:DUF4817 domain-containing protein n=1 Tax=Araneus ventricosus TaxID=182803 RepID=A0A4Y2DVL3_ARAVE|nr:hypothetical protein AVEN_268425-1 [Araneus ventricosus]